MSTRRSLQSGPVVGIGVVVVALFAPAVSVAQEFPDSDTREIASYTLTEAGLAKYTQAVQNLGARANELSNTCDSDDDDQSLAALVARVDAIPEARAAIQSAGLTTREYIVFTLSLVQNGLAAWAANQPGAQLPPGTSMANVNFYRAHEAALQTLGEQIQAVDCDGDAEDEEDSGDER